MIENGFLNVFTPIRPQTLRDQVIAQVRVAIIEGRLKPGDHIIEKLLTDQLAVSRTPVREALIVLENEGLLVAQPNRGSFVRVFNQADVDMVFSMRTTLENFAAELSIDRLSADDWRALELLIDQQAAHIRVGDVQRVRSTDMAFHRVIIERANHPLLHKNWEAIVAQIAALLHVRAAVLQDYDEQLAIGDHKSIVDAYRQRDLNAVKANNLRINARVAGECRFALDMRADAAHAE